jgi:hypothetical protein
MRVQYIIIVPANGGAEAKEGLASIPPGDRTALFLLTDSQAVWQEAEAQGTACALLPGSLPRTGFEDQVRYCAEFLVESAVFSPDRHVAFLPASAMKAGSLPQVPLESEGHSDGNAVICLEVIPTSGHPMAVKAGYTIVDVIFAAQVDDREAGAGRRTMPFFFNWMTYGVHADIGSAGMGWACDIKGVSFMVEGHMSREKPTCSAPVDMLYEIHDKYTASRTIGSDEIADPGFPLHFVPGFRKAMRSSVLFVRNGDGRTSISLDEQLAGHDISILFYPSKKVIAENKAFVINHRRSEASLLGRSIYCGKSYSGPLPPCKIPWDSFLCVVVGHTTNGDVDFFHHIPLYHNLYDYEAATDTRYMKDGTRPYGRQSYPSLFRPVYAKGTLSAFVNAPADITRKVVQTGAYEDVITSAWPIPASPSGFCSDFRKLNKNLWKLETSAVLSTPQTIEAFEAKLWKTMDDLRPHLLLRQLKFYFKEQLIEAVSEVPLMKLLNVHDTIVRRAWEIGTTMIGKRLPALNREHLASEKPDTPGCVHVAYRIGAEMIQRGIDIIASNKEGGVWVSDIDGKCVLGFDERNGHVETLSEELASPRCFFSEGGKINFCDPLAKQILTIPPSGGQEFFPGPGALMHNGHDFHPIAGQVLKNGYVFVAITEAFIVGYFRCNSDGGNLRVLVQPQHARHCLEIFTADEHRMVLASPNESVLHTYDFGSEAWERIDLHHEALTINGLCLFEDTLYIRTPPNVVRLDLDTGKYEYIMHDPGLFGSVRWPYTAFRCFRRNGKTTLFNGSIKNGIAAVELDYKLYSQECT